MLLLLIDEYKEKWLGEGEKEREGREREREIFLNLYKSQEFRNNSSIIF